MAWSRGTAQAAGGSIGAALAILAAGLMLAPPAIGADTYVDNTDGDNLGDTNDCRDPEAPCAGLPYALSKTGTDDTVFAGGDPAPFTTPQVLGDGKSIVRKDFSTSPAIDTSGNALLNTGADSDPALTITSKAGQVRGLHIYSETLPVRVEAGVELKKVTINVSEAIERSIYSPPGAGGKLEVTDSSLNDPTPLPDAGQVGIDWQGDGSLAVSGTSFNGFQNALNADGDGPARVDQVEILHTHGTVGANGVGIRSGLDTELVVDRSLIFGPTLTDGPTEGIESFGAAEITRTAILGHYIGISTFHNPERLKVESTAITTIEDGFGLRADDLTPGGGDLSRVRATNVTVAGEGTQLYLNGNHTRMESSLIGDGQGIEVLGDASCEITHSRGPVAEPGVNGCGFQRTQDPALKSDGYHLKKSSPMIDKGDPDNPPSGARDIDGDKRALDGTGNCNGTKRRDIGADEFKC